MSEVDPRSERAFAQLRASWEPPLGIEDRLLDRIHAQIDSGPGGPDDGGGGNEPGPAGTDSGPLGHSSSPPSLAAKMAHGAKVVGATLGLSAAGLAVLVAASSPLRASDPGPEAKPDDPVTQRETTTVVARDSSPELPPEQPESEPPTNSIAPAPSDTAPTPHRAKPQPEPPRAAAGPTLEAELALMREARTAAPADALVALEAHAREFPSGTLARERDGLRIVALCELGRPSDAQRHLDRFTAASPGSLQLPRIRAACPKLEFPPTDP